MCLLKKIGHPLTTGLVILFVLIALLGKQFNPFIPTLFEAHDNTQAARIIEFSDNIKTGHIPPRLSPRMSFQMGFPLFNHYAPTAYWIGSAIHLLGISVPATLKLVYLLAIVGAFFSSFYLFRQSLRAVPALFGAVVYASSSWVAVEIFVRGNIAELWFIALFPAGLGILLNPKMKTLPVRYFPLQVLVISLTLTAHNVLSLAYLGIAVLVLLFLPNKKRAAFIFCTALLMSSYFLIPAVTELSSTQARSIAQLAQYQDHFVCPGQLWESAWGYGGSGKNCQGTMSFRLGKYQIILALLGLALGMWKSFRQKNVSKRYLFFALLTGGSLFLMNSASLPLWNVARWLAGLFQFPWRFMAFVILGVAFFNGFLIEMFAHRKFALYAGILLCVGVIVTQSKYFSKPWLFSYNEYMVKYGSRDYIENRAAYEAAEYISIKTDYATWRSYQGKTAPVQTQQWSGTTYDRIIPVDKPTTVLPVHYYPQWQILVEGAIVTPQNFDKLGRPVLETSSLIGKTVRVRYNETLIERLSTVVSAIVLVFVGTYAVVSKKRYIWKNQQHISK